MSQPRRGETRARVADARASGHDEACSVCGRSAFRVDALGRCRLERCRRTKPAERVAPPSILGGACVFCDAPIPQRTGDEPKNVNAQLRRTMCATCRKRRHDPGET